mgnify:CR=1 FL=1
MSSQSDYSLSSQSYESSFIDDSDMSLDWSDSEYVPSQSESSSESSSESQTSEGSV